MPARRISDILGETSELSTLAAVSHHITQIQRVYQEAVPPELAKSSRIGWAREGILSVLADNSVMAAKLRQLSTRVLNRLRQSGFEFKSVRIEVQVDRATPAPRQNSAKQLSPRALSAIDEALQDIPESPLKEALERLARRHGASKQALKRVQQDQDDPRDDRQAQNLHGEHQPASVACHDESQERSADRGNRQESQ